MADKILEIGSVANGYVLKRESDVEEGYWMELVYKEDDKKDLQELLWDVIELLGIAEKFSVTVRKRRVKSESA